MNKLIINCPYCGNEFPYDDILKENLILRFQKEIEIQEKLLETKYKLKLQLKEKQLKNKFFKTEKENIK